MHNPSVTLVCRALPKVGWVLCRVRKARCGLFNEEENMSHHSRVKVALLARLQILVELTTPMSFT